MKVLSVETLAMPEIKVVRYQRHLDDRGYFSETYRKSDLTAHPQTPFLHGVDFNQVNESYSKRGAIRGLHFQWNPPMAKFIHLIYGKAVDLAIDIRKGSPNFGKIVGYELNSAPDQDFGEWVWVPAGFAHGIVFLEEGALEYFCTGQWAPDNERGISILSQDIDWSLMAPEMKGQIDQIIMTSGLMTEKDRNGLTITDWKNSPDSENFIYKSG